MVVGEEHAALVGVLHQQAFEHETPRWSPTIVGEQDKQQPGLNLKRGRLLVKNTNNGEGNTNNGGEHQQRRRRGRRGLLVDMGQKIPILIIHYIKTRTRVFIILRILAQIGFHGILMNIR